MSGAWLALVIAAIGLSAYLRARREGKATWAHLRPVLMGLVMLLLFVVLWTLFVARLVGSAHPLLALLLMLAAILVGVVLMALWVKRHSPAPRRQ